MSWKAHKEAEAEKARAQESAASNPCVVARQRLAARGDADPDATMYALLNDAQKEATAMHYKRGIARADVDAWYATEVRRVLVAAGLA